ncbi:hypothetical protein NEMBOFW57_004135 [Staphylotrichum longicolle]|uniref:Uncharacterized protein n=1 Tax=Staphylotrichum longicolle TaxID=669026 RepID=A0AAD4F5U9_9PEZI|nr:hypothetical protein NEMBOFW57_004135 [Staphylotrichum longicolle]
MDKAAVRLAATTRVKSGIIMEMEANERSVVVSLVLAVNGVDAGSRAWQPPIVHAKAALAVRDLSGINNIYSNGTNGSSNHLVHTHQKRYYGITNPANTGPYPRLWPAGNINACFEQVDHTHKSQTKSTRQILYDDLITARELWRTTGLDDKDGNFQFNILADNDPGCARELRSTHLLIQYAGEGERQMSTTVGVDQPLAAPESNRALRDLGPSMTLTDILDIGKENVVAKYAHEMGHSWGLHHEHQNPKWWDEKFTQVERTNWFFSEENFKCENLADFDKAMEGVPRQPDYEWRGYRNQICRDRFRAIRGQFAGGLNYLPIDEPGMVDDGKDAPDWESIMLYPSNAGGKTVGGVKQPVLAKRHGDLIALNFKPSKRDVQASGSQENSSNFIGQLLNVKSNKPKNIFDKVRKKDPDSSCV